MFKELSESGRVSVLEFCSHALMVFCHVPMQGCSQRFQYILARNTLPEIMFGCGEIQGSDRC